MLRRVAFVRTDVSEKHEAIHYERVQIATNQKGHRAILLSIQFLAMHLKVAADSRNVGTHLHGPSFLAVPLCFDRDLSGRTTRSVAGSLGDSLGSLRGAVHSARAGCHATRGSGRHPVLPDTTVAQVEELQGKLSFHTDQDIKKAVFWDIKT
jgi:hypothetical protein